MKITKTNLELTTLPKIGNRCDIFRISRNVTLGNKTTQN